jgi:branched-chain amino acid transport system ATP-binding protein
MLAIGRALLTRSERVLLDEPSMGLAPIIMEQNLEIVTALNRRQGTSFPVASQDITLSLRHAHRGYILDNGGVALEGSAEELLGSDDLHQIYLGRPTARRKRTLR